MKYSAGLIARNSNEDKEGRAVLLLQLLLPPNDKIRDRLVARRIERIDQIVVQTGTRIRF